MPKPDTDTTSKTDYTVSLKNTGVNVINKMTLLASLSIQSQDQGSPSLSPACCLRWHPVRVSVGVRLGLG